MFFILKEIVVSSCNMLCVMYDLQLEQPGLCIDYNNVFTLMF